MPSTPPSTPQPFNFSTAKPLAKPEAQPINFSTRTFFNQKKVLLTGHTGFKGAWLKLWLEQLGAKVSGISLPPLTTPNLFNLLNSSTSQRFNGEAPSTSQRLNGEAPSTLQRFNGEAPSTSQRFNGEALAQPLNYHVDIRDASALANAVQGIRPEIVFHLAAQPLVRAGYADPLGTFATNVMGTANLLEALRATPAVRVIVVITTDKVYANREWPYPYREDDHLGGHDPYSASKACTEILTASYRQSFFAPPQPFNPSTAKLFNSSTALASARAGNVIGGGDWSEDRLIPDAIRAWQSNTPLIIRRPVAVRPWQHVLEPLHGYLSLAYVLWYEPELAGAYNFGPYTHEAATVREVVELAREAYGKGEITWGEGNQGPHEAGLLKLEIAKAQSVLGFKPRWNLAEAVERTMSWYKRLEKGKDARELCEADIAEFMATP